MDAGAWRLAWLPPSMPYYSLGDEYAAARGFTKRLIFSAWAIVPKAISVLVSYEAERRTVEASGYASQGYDRSAAPACSPSHCSGRMLRGTCAIRAWHNSQCCTSYRPTPVSVFHSP